MLERRSFLKIAGASAFSVCSPLLFAQDLSWDAEFDVIVVGSGFAGLAAAIEARKYKASVLVIEKMDAFGGNSMICAGDMAVPDSPVQRRCGILKDSPLVMLQDLERASGQRASAHAKAVCFNALETWKWTKDELGVEWVMDRVQNDWGQTYPRGIMNTLRSGSAIIQAELDTANRLKADLRSNCLLEKILLDSSGRVAGVQARTGYEFPNPSSGKTVRLKAKSGIMLATGGFSADIVFRQKANRLLIPSLPTSNQPGATSEALQEALRIGAKAVDLDKIQVMSWNSSEEIFLGQSWAFIEYVTLPRGIWLSTKTGKPVTDSQASHKERTDSLLNARSQKHEIAAILPASESIISGFDPSELNSLIRQGIIHEYSSLKALSSDLDIPLQELHKTVLKKYQDNRVIGSPWHAILLVPKVHHCMGGLDITGMGQVKAAGGEDVIPGFYAAGEVTGGIFGSSRLPSHSCTDALVMGRIAGKSAALHL